MDIRCHYPITLPYEFKPWIDLYDPRFGRVKPHEITAEIAVPISELWRHNNVFCRWLRQQDLVVYTMRMFRSVPNIEYQLHVDVDPTAEQQIHHAQDAAKYVYASIVKINFIYHSWGSTMTWYTLKNGSRAELDLGYSGYTVYKFNKEDCDQIYHTDCNTACLINGGRIHTLTNGGNQDSPRLCYSLMLQNRWGTLTWDQAVKDLSSWLVA